MVLFVSHKKWSPLNRCVCLSCFILIYSSRVSVCLILCSCTAISAHCNPLVKSAIQHPLKFKNTEGKPKSPKNHIFGKKKGQM